MPSITADQFVLCCSLFQKADKLFERVCRLCYRSLKLSQLYILDSVKIDEPEPRPFATH